MRYVVALLFTFSVAFAWAQGGVEYRPAGASQILVRGETYYYSGGSFYRPSKGGYVRVEPPLGARVPSVPGDSGSFTMGDDRYFVTSNGTFFLYDPRGDDYSVVTAPHGWRDYYRNGRPELYALPAPAPVPQPVQPAEIPRAYPRPDPRYRTDGYYGRYRTDYGSNWNYIGRYGFRDDIRGESYHERRSTCRRIATDQSRRARVGPYRRQPGSYWDEYGRCMR